MRNMPPILILVAVLFTIPLYAACNDNPDEEVTADTEETTEDDALYACPMHPDETSTDPEARCSVCGMFLEPVEEMMNGGPDTETSIGH